MERWVARGIRPGGRGPPFGLAPRTTNARRLAGRGPCGILEKEKAAKPCSGLTAPLV